MIIKRKVTKTDEVQIKTICLDNLLQLIHEQNNNPIEAAYLFEAHSTQAYSVWIRVNFIKTVNNQEVSIVDKEPEKNEAELPFNINELLGLPVNEKIKEEQVQSKGHVELTVVIHHNNALYLLNSIKQNYTDELEHFIQALQRKPCIDEKKLQEHALNYSKNPPITINLKQNFFSVEIVQYTLKEIFNNRERLTMYAMMRRNDNAIVLTIEGQELIYQSNQQDSSPKKFLEVMQHFMMSADFATFKKYFSLC